MSAPTWTVTRTDVPCCLTHQIGTHAHRAVGGVAVIQRIAVVVQGNHPAIDFYGHQAGVDAESSALIGLVPVCIAHQAVGNVSVEAHGTPFVKRLLHNFAMPRTAKP